MTTASTSNSPAPKIAALILSYSSPETLSAVIQGINAQKTVPDLIMVIDNGGEPPVSTDIMSLTVIPVMIDRLPDNLGPAGGWSHALKRFRDSGRYQWAWLLDDDAVPAPDCLEKLLEHGIDDSSGFPAPIVVDHVTQERRRYPSWCGPLLPREAVERAGTPRVDLVWWAEDTEYLSLRMRGIGLQRVVVEDATVIHYGTRREIPRSAARIYYETRNSLWMRLYMRSQWKTPRKWWRIVRIIPRSLVFALRSPHPMSALKALALGVRDGLAGRLGRRFELAEGPLRPAR